MCVTSNAATHWSEIGQIEIIGRLAEIGRELRVKVGDGMKG